MYILASLIQRINLVEGFVHVCSKSASKFVQVKLRKEMLTFYNQQSRSFHSGFPMGPL